MHFIFRHIAILSLLIMGSLANIGLGNLAFAEEPKSFFINMTTQNIQEALINQGAGEDIAIDTASFTDLINNERYNLNEIATLDGTDKYTISKLEIKFNNNFTAVISNLNTSKGKIAVQGRFTIYEQVPVFAQTVQKGEIIQETNVIWKKISTQRLRQQYLHDPSDMIGKQAVRRLGLGKPVLMRDVKSPTIVKKGGTITLIYRSKHMELKTVAIALQSASAGDIIKVKNIKSGAIINAMVTENFEAIVNYTSSFSAKALVQ